MNQPGNSTTTNLMRQASAREFLAVIFRRKWIILGLFLVTTATVITVAFTTPTYYISSGRILVRRGERQSMLSAQRQIVNDWEQELGSEMQIMKSVPVVKRAREVLAEEAKRSNVKLTLDPGSIDVEVMGKSNVIALGYTDQDPTVAQAACRAVIDAYIEYRSQGMKVEQPQRFFEEQLAGIDTQLKALLDERQRYSEANGVAVPEQQANNQLNLAGQLEQRRSDLAADLAAAQSTEQAMRKMQSDPDIDLPSYDGTGTYTNEAALVLLKQRVVEQQTRIAQLNETLRDDAPEVVAAKQTLETLQGMLRKEVDQRVRLAGARVTTLQARVAVLDQEIAGVRAKLEKAPEDFKRLDGIDEQINALRTRRKDLSDSRDLAMITANTSNDVNVVLLAPASVAAPTNSLDIVRLMLAPAFSLLVGIAIAFFVDGLDLTVRTANQAEEYLDLPVLASMSERRRRNG